MNNEDSRENLSGLETEEQEYCSIPHWVELSSPTPEWAEHNRKLLDQFKDIFGEKK